MGVKHIRLHGTRDEIDFTIAALPERTSDRVLEYRQIFNHMNEYLDADVWEMCLSVRSLNAEMLSTLQTCCYAHPRMLCKVTHFNNNSVWWANYEEDDKDYPGPFGALCRVYGLPSYLTHKRVDGKIVEAVGTAVTIDTL